jgi:hypothetical protein
MAWLTQVVRVARAFHSHHTTIKQDHHQNSSLKAVVVDASKEHLSQAIVW